jgi:hypothetical protein
MSRSSARNKCRVAGGWPRLAAVGICAALVYGRAAAFDLHSADATYTDGVFRVSFEAVLDAPLESIEAVLADYTLYRRLDPRIESAKSLGRQPDGTQLVRTRISACAAVFCRTVDRVERFEQQPGLLVATVVPERSDMRHGIASTRFRSLPSGTLVIYHAEFEPDFWVPGFIGRRYVVGALREAILKMFTNVEREARAR